MNMGPKSIAWTSSRLSIGSEYIQNTFHMFIMNTHMGAKTTNLATRLFNGANWPYTTSPLNLDHGQTQDYPL